MQLTNLNSKRLILVDLDGTVLNNDGKTMNPLTKKALMQAQADGHIVAIITGRPFRAIKDIYHELGLTSLLTNFDGAHISDPSRREFKRIVFSINSDIIQQIINEPVIKASVENIIFEYYDKVLIWKEDADLDQFFHLSDLKSPNSTEQLITGSPWELWDGPSTNIVLKLKKSSYKNRVFRTLAKYHDAVKIQSDILYGISNPSEKPVFTLTNKNASKGFAVNIIAQYYNKNIQNVIAFGDQMNDFEMIQKVGYGVAMKNAADALKFVADGVTHKTNDEGGVGDYLNHILKGDDY
ncbi:hypothetical protein JN01_0455 [Entomoplasma freundtii]|uniref:Phosphatase n=1 Tax=Entomoplasma freundtii TaxID=74700 RepID=A0A2K8NQM1_9MOLU|nr:Cof-type HAD-IIB family hydrolase [Entomoplasma freundtii]ATZ16145.1 phosphatase [Entomoplasma freundtii]TDY56954.1 hypothetical protein JN01_0455 [Entomoplasma freundtii]